MITTKPGHKSKNDDCYFYYYGSGCAKGTICPFRHEPAALAQETVCLFWKNGHCSKPNCMFRHMDLSKKRNVIPCYWEKTTTGCQKAHCPFLHDKPKDTPLTEPVIPNANSSDGTATNSSTVFLPNQTSSMENPMVMTTEQDVSKIIVNKNKIDELRNRHVIPQSISLFSPAKATINSEVEKKNESNRVVLPPKQRLGIKIEVSQGKKRSVKDRLGAVVNPKHHCEIYELEESDSLLDDMETDMSLEEKLLRDGAIKTIDLRNRLGKKEHFSRDNQIESIIRNPGFNTQQNQRQAETMSDHSIQSGPESYDETEEEYDSPALVKKAKKPKKEKKKKDKSKKKDKIERKLEKLKQKKLKLEKTRKKSSKKSTNNEILPEELEPEDISSLESYVRNLKKERNKMLQNEIDELVSERVDHNDDKTAKHKHSPVANDKTKASANSLNQGKATIKHKNTSQEIHLQKNKKNVELPTKNSGVHKTSYSNKRAKLLKNISNAVVKKKESVRSILNDVDSLLKSAENQNLLDTKDRIQTESDDVMKQLDEIINS